tara:strand:+ start:103 stop:966 length:864 start_codon:yes stop_codon:yes gene_type:complete
VHWNTPYISRKIDEWIDEDIGKGDLTKYAITKDKVKAKWIAKEDGIFCGVEILKLLFERIDKEIEYNFLIIDGEKFSKNQKILELNGEAKSLLSLERTALNIAMHLSGVASFTNKIVEKLKNTDIKLADTRKTTPGLRILEKYAFKCGGGINHRMGLYDAAMIKENHIAWSDNLINAVKRLRENIPFTSHIIIEAETIEQAKEAIIAGADSILLDEINPDLLRKSIKELRMTYKELYKKNNAKNLIIEVSGINHLEIEKYLIEGIDYISTSSSVTKSKWIDFSMRYI